MRCSPPLGAVPREEFVPLAQRPRAYLNIPLPIAAGQTISQPLIVALMTEMLDPQPADVMLEVGTGSGYQAAVLSQLVKHVYSVEIVPELADSASNTLRQTAVRQHHRARRATATPAGRSMRPSTALS